jgi:hypothetical protein
VNGGRACGSAAHTGAAPSVRMQPVVTATDARRRRRVVRTANCCSFPDAPVSMSRGAYGEPAASIGVSQNGAARRLDRAGTSDDDQKNESVAGRPALSARTPAVRAKIADALQHRPARWTAAFRSGASVGRRCRANYCCNDNCCWHFRDRAADANGNGTAHFGQSHSAKRRSRSGIRRASGTDGCSCRPLRSYELTTCATVDYVHLQRCPSTRKPCCRREPVFVDGSAALIGRATLLADALAESW